MKVGVIINIGSGAMSFMEVTDVFETDNATYFYDGESQMWIAGDNPLWPLGGFEHAMVSLYGQCTTLGIGDVSMSPFTHYTKNNILHIESADLIQEVAIYNLLGQQVISERIQSNSSALNLNTLKDGVYLTKVNINEKIQTFRIIVK
ncbi:putative secreted protein (Por secretion system target) [Winogradskyella epiphytica]|uniref:Putative secreted protein (Por secretion system target) n=1 Tax=Winogradskyella epiphytica TaxID=262005 RepID=A0A2V4XFR0_9FLAO|nr:T9SS type A sorting domain-containing protein [Winogradskyella epiphytica]PYE79624.1 putative secreted protein (Por secretion system target) [Winogradskyella epiphytica]GGW73787.1 hypothetical protein GCM10008085_27560 [Winogradskyella epiphytica]